MQEGHWWYFLARPPKHLGGAPVLAPAIRRCLLFRSSSARPGPPARTAASAGRQVGAPRPADATKEAAGAAFDRVGARAWRLALWITGHEGIAAQVVSETFANPIDKAGATRSDVSLLGEVHLRARQARATLPRSETAGTPAVGMTVLQSIAALTAPQRAVIDLALVARLSMDEIAVATAAPRAEVMLLLHSALQALAPGGRDAARRVSGLPPALPGAHEARPG